MSGSSSSSTAGRGASDRASATRFASPPLSFVTWRFAEAGEADEVQQLVDPCGGLASRPTPAHAQAEADVLRDREMREQLLVLEHQADAAAVRRAGR